MNKQKEQNKQRLYIGPLKMLIPEYYLIGVL